ncbi:CCA tRNA nucleotidyltransferase 1, mitochondrial isoform X1 [Nylanderia fulva]|uniref:CCA tRNA nucleotidyltransferase 1, mitochondrial isoform X1 n=2 Tax=Nylanderia fulva TaxID=613905 RepID=UPI0010FBA8B2|nr:CCA tRNA nucleotidyltransferase 1, mitochondrial isoform X1 [Nylanderia fulva]
MLSIIRQTTNLLRREITGGYKFRSIVRGAWTEVKMTDQLTARSNPVIMRLDSPEFRSVFTPELESLASLFHRYNYELRIAGGAVRDILMGKQPKDLDFATDATPLQMKEMFAKEEVRTINEKGEKHGTITARINDKENFEITTLRIDVLTNGRHAQVEFTKDWKLDANRRDLTINSMYLDLDGKLYDYFYGYEDLQRKRVVFVGDAGLRIREDYLRILRYFRFYGRIMDNPDQHDEATIKAIKENVDGLSLISGERIWSEWSKILTGNFGLELTLKLLECGSGKYIGLPQELVVENFRIVYQRARSNDVTLKPVSLIVSMLKNENEVMTLHGRLKLSNSDRDLALFLVQHREYMPCETPLKPYQRLIFVQPASKHELYREFVKEVLRYRGATDLLDELERWKIPRFPINGNAMRERVANQKLIGEVFIHLKNMWVDEDFKLTEEQLLEQIPRILDGLEEKWMKNPKYFKKKVK